MMTRMMLPSFRSTPFALVGVLLLLVFLYYVLVLDQGLLLSLVQGNLAFDQNVIHEILHDARHTAGLPCH